MMHWLAGKSLSELPGVLIRNMSGTNGAVAGKQPSFWLLNTRNIHNIGVSFRSDGQEWLRFSHWLPLKTTRKGLQLKKTTPNISFPLIGVASEAPSPTDQTSDPRFWIFPS